MIKVSHELPINMLDRSFEINDYEYCLPHLLDQNEAYRKHFEDAKESGSYIIMDNSLHELGKAYDTDRLLHWIHHLEPNEFIVPDVWQDQTATLVNAKYWMNGYKLPKKFKHLKAEAQGFANHIGMKFSYMANKIQRNLTDDEQKILINLIEGDTKLRVAPAKLRELSKESRKVILEMAQEYVDMGLISPATFKKNKDTYMYK